MVTPIVTEADVAEFRAEAEALMLDTGKALRPTGGRTYDPGTQTEGDAFTDLDSGPCKIQDRGLVATQAEVGERTSVSARLSLHRPVASTALRVGDVWEMTAASSMSLSSVGDRFRVVGIAPGTIKTARRYEVEVVLS